MLDDRSDMKIIITLLLICLVALSGCGSKPSSDEYPAPGEMRLVSITPLERRKEVINLIPNGAFNDWLPGSPVCAGFSAPDPERATLSRSENAGSPVLVQQWQKTETSKTPAQCLHTTVDALKGDTEYQLSVLAEAAGGATATFSVMEKEASGNHLLLAPEVIVTMPGLGQLKQYTGTFRTKSGGQIIISVAGRALAEGGAGIKWHEWLLSEAS
jgi:hypothetical protein